MSKSFAKATIWVTVSEIIFNISGFVIHSVVGRILGPADYGRYGLVVTLTTMVIILIGNGIPTAMSKYISEIFESNPRMVGIIKRQAIILQSIIIGSITVLFFLSAPLISKILGDPTLTPLFQISTLIIPAFAAASFYFSYFTGLHEFGIQSILKITRSVLRLIFIIALAYYFKLKGSIVGYIMAPGILFFIGYAIDKIRISPKIKAKEIELENCHPGLDPTSNEIAKISMLDSRLRGNDNKMPDDITFDWKKLVNYAWQIVIFFLAYELLISIDLYLVKGILKDDYLTGIYNAALTIGRIPYYIFYALTVVLLPVISKTTAEKNHTKAGEIVNQTLRLMLVLLVPSVILMSVFSAPIIKLFYSSRYIDAAAPMSVLVWGVGFLTIYYVFCFVMSGAGKVKIPMILSIFGLAVNTILNYFLIKKYGIMGSAIATSIASAVVTFFMLYYVWRDFGVKIKLKSFLKISSAGLVVYAVSFFFSKGSLIFIPWSVILFVFYLIILYTLREIKKEDLQFLARSFGFKKNK
ncbi:MAG TPA: flippase [Candidatus Moranbacteria bacterium]|nr:flippase [Candidatus Moranbacteria bacterium]